jgi:hypothetical protein
MPGGLVSSSHVANSRTAHIYTQAPTRECVQVWVRKGTGPTSKITHAHNVL